MKNIALSLLLWGISNVAIANVITFGIVPQQSASRLAAQWTPLMAYLSEHTGEKFVFATAANIPTFEKRLSQGDYDFAYMNPYHYVTFHQSNAYEALSKAKNRRIKGIIVARKDANLTQLSQLNGETLAFPAPAAFAASILTRSALVTQEVTFKPDYVSSHDSVYLSVAKGFYPAGGGIVRTFNSMDESIRSQLEIIYTTDGYTPHAIAHHPRINEELAKQVQQLLAELDQTDEGKALLKPLSIQGFDSAKDSDWDDVRSLNIQEISQ
ncbi:phosphate/phosphite/phosphonate ABC transporter substrate-binding protein [uncultured Vibrio sp.]|uniref:phosphate/phosphite/phosphonate ABC transporter substrate-binding protein n=1 Tax=uncultured Vibrio sp. TaxID=114054 RepID=UPI000916ECD6|nr:phosphate/phosphite/phosphonate ABC transporter substrate-binding protein [uncultured Vibrio sp.]OIQ26297.1 MAG: phosphate ABC transporter substrate-binding protein [Vibrio sp. MedPE-SWchi]